MREFETGAKRDTDNGKLDYEGFYSPLVMERFAEYMHKHRQCADGSLRDSDNWQKGIPISVYFKSFIRHTMELWKAWRVQKQVDLEIACAILFNVQGMILETLKSNAQESKVEKREGLHEDTALQDNHDRGTPELCTESKCPNRWRKAEGCHLESNPLRVYCVSARGERVLTQTAQTD